MSGTETSELLNSIAIVGMAGRFPGANDIEQFWQNLRDGVESITFFSDEELLAAGVSPETLRDPNYVKAGALLEDIDMFDAGFFGYTPREASIMDPQHRLFLECAWQALEHSGHCAENDATRTGVFGGVSMNSYLLFNLYGSSAIDNVRSLQSVMGNNHDFLTTRVSYKLDLKGPSLDVQSSCSTSLVAVHLACQSLLNGECDMALAGGVSIVLPQISGYIYQEQGIYSPDGHCRAFDADSKGTAGGRGAAVVALKRLEDAQADGDHIYAVVRGSAINNDGQAKVGYTAPSVEGQADVVAEALAVAGIAADTISYIETHGTGTPLGDPIEIEALTQAFRATTDRKQFCAIGSVKTNIGHLDAAAGVTGLIKTALALWHGELPPSLNFERPNPKIDFAGSPFYVNDKLNKWERNGGPRRAGVSSFGMGGTNAHVVLEEAPPPAVSSASRPFQLLSLSARTETALQEAAENLAAHLQSQPDINIADAAFTLHLGRKAFGHRRISVCRNAGEAVQLLANGVSKGLDGRPYEMAPKVAFMFPGQGAQYVRMGQGLYESEPVFREQLDQCLSLLAPHVDGDLRGVLFPPDNGTDVASEQLRQTAMAQPALFAVEFSLARLWMSWGVRPEAMIGHSIGEYVAACLSGVFSLEHALALVARRGKLMQEQPLGSMLAVPLPQAQVEALLDDGLSLAAVNEPGLCVVSGADEKVRALAARLADKGCRPLHTSHAFHSEMMDPILDEFTAEVAKVKLNPPEISYISNVSGAWITPEEATSPAYWARQLRGTVRFSDGIQTLLRTPGRLMLEVGPGRALSGLVERQKIAGARLDVIASMRHPKEKQEDEAALLTALGKLWIAGVAPDWRAFYAAESRLRAPLPTYPFQRKRYWVEEARDDSVPKGAKPAGRKTDIADWFYLPSWKRSPPPPVDAKQFEQPARWLIFADADGLAKELAERLRNNGDSVTLIDCGDVFQPVRNDAASLDPARCEEYDRLLENLNLAQDEPLRVAHLWCLDELEDAAALERGFYSLVFLTQALGRRDHSGPVRMTVFTAGAHDVTGEELLRPGAAAALGAAKVIPQEHPHFHCRAIDLPKGRGVAIVDLLFAELVAESDDAVVAYRGAHRWVQAFEPVRRQAADSVSSALREGGVYLITGGVGGIGMEVADYLAKTCHARLILTGRSELPGRKEWEKLVSANTEQAPALGKIKKMLDLEACGAAVAYMAADVTDEAQMRAAIEFAETTFGALHGVIHAAGAEKSAPIIQQITREECEAHLRPKVKGVAVLERVLADRKLDFCLLQSSLSSVLGALGFVAYTAAHLYLDACAHRHNRAGSTPWLCVNWDNWLNWKEPVAALAGGEAEYFMTPEEGQEAFARVLCRPLLGQVVVSTGDLELRRTRWLNRETAAQGGETDKLSSIQHERPELGTAYAAPSGPGEETLARIWAEALGLERVGRNDNYFELGGDSVLSIQIISRAAQAGLRLNANQIFEHQTIAELAAVAVKCDDSSHETSRPTGVAPLTPIQYWFFEQELPEESHFNLPALLEVDARIAAPVLEEAVRAVFDHHDAFRLRFRRTGADADIEQSYADSGDALVFSKIDLHELSAAEQTQRIRDVASNEQRSLNLEQGPLARAVLFDFGETKPSRVLLAVHHLVVDVVSWRILLADVSTAVEQLSAAGRVRLPPRTASYKEWAEGLVKLAQSPRLLQEAEFWLSQPWERAQPVPVDHEADGNALSSMATHAVGLEESATQALLTELPKAFKTQITEALLTALLRTFARWSGQSSLLLHLEGHGREDILPGVDVSRTVGWFTSLFPVLLTQSAAASPADALRGIKEQVRSLPNKGVGFGILRYLSADETLRDKLRALPDPQISFLYMGQFDGALSGNSLARMVEGECGPAASPKTQRSHLIDIACMVKDGKLRVELMYNARAYETGTIEKLSADFFDEIRSLIDAGKTSKQPLFSPSDFPEAKLSQKDLDILLANTGQAGSGSAR